MTRKTLITAIALLAALALVAGCGKEEQQTSPRPETLNEEATTTLNEYYTNMDYSCSSDTDCEPKDIGNCCGEYMQCVNKNAKPTPELVKELCRKENAASICGSPTVINGCKCSDRCEPR